MSPNPLKVIEAFEMPPPVIESVHEPLMAWLFEVLVNVTNTVMGEDKPTLPVSEESNKVKRLVEDSAIEADCPNGMIKTQIIKNHTAIPGIMHRLVILLSAIPRLILNPLEILP